MAGIAYVRKRVFNPELVIDPDGVLPQMLKNSQIHGNNPVYYIKWVGATQAGEELGTAATSVKDGTTTPFIVNIVSASALDDYDTAAGHAHHVALIGLTVSSVANYTAGEVPVVTAEVLRTNGVADVNSTRYFVWLDHAYVCSWGTGGTDAAGNIDCESPTGTVLMTIVAGQNESMGGLWHFPPDRRLFTQSVIFSPTATLAAGDGVILTGTYTGFDQADNTDPDLDVDYFPYIHYGAPSGVVPLGEYKPIGRYTTVNSACLWEETLVANTQTISIEIKQYIDRGN